MTGCFRKALPGAIAVILLFAAGCASIRVTDPDRTATEQFLLSTAAAKAVMQLSFDALRGRNIFVDTEYFAAAEDKFVIGELRAQLLLAGVQLVPTRDEAQIILEVRSSGVGIDRTDSLFGLPSLVLSADSDDSVGIPFQTPELALYKNVDQQGFASVAYVAYWKQSGEVVASSGPYIGRTFREDIWVFGFGPNTAGDIPTVEGHE